MDQIQIENAPVQDPSIEFDNAVEERSPDRMLKLAQANYGTPVADAAVHAAKTMVDTTNRWDDLTAPIADAKTPQEAHLKAADAYKTVKDNPQWGTALIKYLMGDKEGAARQVTGGDEKDRIVYDKNGQQIKETYNALGQIVNRVDPSSGRVIPPEEFNQRGGGFSTLDNTLGYMTEKAMQKNNAEGLVNTVNQTNAWTGALKAQDPLVKRAYANLIDIKKDDIAGPLFAKALGTATQANSNTASSSNNSSLLQNWQQGKGVREGQQIDKSISSGMGLEGVWHFNGKGGITNDKGETQNFNELAQRQNTSNVGKENTNQLSAAQSQLIAGMRAAKLSPERQAMMLDTFNALADVNKANTELVGSVGKPAYIFLPSANSSTDRYANGQVQLMQNMFNKEAAEGFNAYYERALEAYKKTGTVPNRGELEKAYTSSPEYRNLQKIYADRAKADLAEPLPEQPKPVAKPSAVAPPKQRKSLSEIQQSVGG